MTWMADNPEEGICQQLAGHAAAAGGVVHAARELTLDSVPKWMLDSKASFHLIRSKAIKDARASSSGSDSVPSWPAVSEGSGTALSSEAGSGTI